MQRWYFVVPTVVSKSRLCETTTMATATDDDDDDDPLLLCCSAAVPLLLLPLLLLPLLLLLLLLALTFGLGTLEDRRFRFDVSAAGKLAWKGE